MRFSHFGVLRGKNLGRLPDGGVGTGPHKKFGSRMRVFESTAAASDPIAENSDTQESFVTSFREAWPYIQGHRKSTFVIVLAGEVITNRAVTDSVLQDIALLHGLGVHIVLVPGTQHQIDELLVERGQQPTFKGAYRITDDEALEAAMEAAGRVRLDVEARLSRGVSIPVLRRHGENNRWHEAGLGVSSGNFVAAKRRGIVDGIDYGYTGEVRKVDVSRIRERLNSGSIVMLSNLGYNSVGEVLNCNAYEVATACATGLHADKLLCLLPGPVVDDRGRPMPYLTLDQALNYIRKKAEESELASIYVKSLFALLGPAQGKPTNGAAVAAATPASPLGASAETSGLGPVSSNGSSGPIQRGLAIGGAHQLGQEFSYIPLLAAAVYACRGGVRRVHLLDSNVEGALLLELYTRDGAGCMVSSDMYEGTRTACLTDIAGIMTLLQPLEEEGVLVPRTAEEIQSEISTFTVVERDGVIIACASLVEYPEKAVGELGAFVVAPECRGQGRGDTLLDYVENLAADRGLRRLFLLTTQTAEWFVQRGFTMCELAHIPDEKRERINSARGSQCFMKALMAVNPDRWLPISSNTVTAAAQAAKSEHSARR